MTPPAGSGASPRASRRGGRNARSRPAPLHERLVLLDWMLQLFEVASLDDLLDQIKRDDLEGISEEGITFYCHSLMARMERSQLSHVELLEYDERIVRFWREITTAPERRGHTLKHFQYVTLLFSEVYLDRYFGDRNALRASLNRFVEGWNTGRASGDKAQRFGEDDINKLAFWMATGSGKTLLMHVHIKQYLHHLQHSDAWLDESYISRLFSGERNHPSRDALILLSAFGLELRVEDVDEILLAADYRPLVLPQTLR